LYVNKHVAKSSRCRNCFPFQTANVAYFQTKIILSGFSAYPDGSPCHLIRISGVLPHSAIRGHPKCFTFLFSTSIEEQISYEVSLALFTYGMRIQSNCGFVIYLGLNNV